MMATKLFFVSGAMTGLVDLHYTRRNGFIYMSFKFKLIIFWFSFLYVSWDTSPFVFIHPCLILQGSCSRIWQRDSYWKARPSSRRWVGWICNLITKSYFLTFWLKVMNFTAMSIHFLYHVKPIVQQVGKIHGLINALAASVLLPWNRRGNHI